MRSEDLLDLIGEADDRHIHDARPQKRRFPHWARWTAAIAACLCIVIAGALWFRHTPPGANAGSGGDTDLRYMYYTGPVLPLTALDDSEGITAARHINFDFSPYISTEHSYEDADGTVHSYLNSNSESLVTDSYTLSNETGQDKTLTLLYPFVGNMSETDLWPNITLDGAEIDAALYPGPYSGGFQGVFGAANQENGSANLKALDCFEGYAALLADGSYQASAFDLLPVLDQSVTVYHLHDYVYSAVTEDVSPCLNMEFHIDYEQTMVFSYNMNGSTIDPESGYCSRRISGIEYRPNAAPERQHPDDGYVILLGEDIDSYTVTGYENLGCDELLPDLDCTVTRYETTLGEILHALFAHFLSEYRLVQDALDAPAVDLPTLDLYLGLAAELMQTYGMLGESPVDRYDSGMLEDIFSATLNDSRVLYYAFELTIPAGETTAVEITLRKDGSTDYVGRDKGKDGYDMATQLGSTLHFTAQSASISGYDEIEIVTQNFGFDIPNSITETALDLSIPHYWLEVRKLKPK